MRGWIGKALDRWHATEGKRSIFGLQSQTSIIEQYVSSSPGPRSALDIFKGEWVSKLPGQLARLSTGSIPLFEDPRVEWFVSQLGGIEEKTVLELGPLEGGHTYMLELLGAASILSIEANPHAYLKCLIIKELLHLERARFLCGDFVAYLRTTEERFDVCLASGVLYHMANPVELIALLAKVTDRLCLWTHYHDEESLSQIPGMARPFSKGGEWADYAGFQHRLHRRVYGRGALSWARFHGGRTSSVCWLSRGTLLRCLEYFGFTKIEIGFDEPHDKNGPSLALTAFRS